MTTVLVVDDEDLLVAMIQDVLEDEGYSVVTAHDGQAGWEAVERHVPDVVVSDVMMPRLDGWGLWRALQAAPAYRQIPVILMSAGAQLQGQGHGTSRAEGGGQLGFVRKPFALEEFLRVLTSVLAQASTP
jgi:CheY-like chemotaxis protein